MRIYMDVCCFNRPFDDQTQDRIRIESEAVLVILTRCLEDWILIGSEVVDYEISKIPDDERRKKVEVLASISREKVIVNDDVVKRALEFEKMGLKGIDALHLACAERSSEILLTTDDDFVRKVKENKDRIRIKVENPVIWLMEVLEDEQR